ncbi:hypothetical protein BAU15_02770 [Enterococcus sp. JM4C]|uniref:ABC transporter permease n=1 Tax=Candidatus Enterococcus huntleyi TaxID=1857217 RepID=UPI001379BBB6|nr:ABC transporter permease [Enterococcus sp. JM4C]KAF1299584.1 hypothetical protein BAU15_02770 [Enterococcus sp. JM4C]
MKAYVKIELKKISLKSQFVGLLIANIFVMLLSVSLGMLIPMSMEVMEGMNFSISAAVLVDTLIKAIFIIWEAVLLAMLVVSEFQNNTALMFYTYPVQVKKIIMAKVVIVLSLITAFIFISELIQNIILYLVSFIFPSINYQFDISLLFTLIITTVGSVLMGLIPLFFGMLNKSVIATVTVSIFIMCIVTSSAAGPGGILSKGTAAIFLGILGVIAGKATFARIEKEDFISK